MSIKSCDCFCIKIWLFTVFESSNSFLSRESNWISTLFCIQVSICFLSKCYKNCKYPLWDFADDILCLSHSINAGEDTSTWALSSYQLCQPDKTEDRYRRRLMQNLPEVTRNLVNTNGNSPHLHLLDWICKNRI